MVKPVIYPPFVMFGRFNKKCPLVLFENCPLSAKSARCPVHCQRVRFCHPKFQVKIRNGKRLQKDLHNPTKRVKPIVTRWHVPFCAVQHKFQTVGNKACMDTFPDLRPFADMCARLLGFCDRFAVKPTGVFVDYLCLFV